MVEKFGMSELGPWHISSEKGEVSGETRSASDKAIQRLTQEAYDRSKQLLTTNRSVLDKVAAALLEHETLTGEEIKLIVQVRALCCMFQQPWTYRLPRRERASAARVDKRLVCLSEKKLSKSFCVGTNL